MWNRVLVSLLDKFASAISLIGDVKHCRIKDVARDFPNCDAVGVDLVVNPE